MREMKDSGFEWIGSIPKEWETKRLQFCLKEVKVKNNPIQTTQILSLMKDVGVLPYEEKGDVGNKSKEDISEYHLAYPNTIVLNCMNILIGSVGISNYFGCVSPVYYVFEETDECDLRFVNYIFNTREFQKELRKYAKGILEIRLRVSADDIFKRRIPLPKKSIQKAIADFLDAKCSEIDTLHADIEKEIAVLEEYKRSVITETVTKGLNPDIEMKDSGIEWIGYIAKECIVVRLKYDTYMKGRIGWQGLKSQDFIDEGPFCVTSTDFQDGKVVWERCYHVSEERYEMDPYIQIKEGDLLISKDGTIGKLALIDKLPDKACLNSHLLIIRPSKRYSTKYLFYVLSSDIFVHYYSLVGSGSTMQSLSQEKLGEFSFPIWSIPKQEKIVAFLDSNCAEIDAIISKKREQLSIVAEYKKSLIYEYVTGKKEL